MSHHPDSPDPRIATGVADTQFDSLTRAACRRLRGRIPHDMIEDCQQEVKISLWRTRLKFEALPQSEWEAYATACIYHRIWRFLQQECRYRSRILLSDDSRSLDNEADSSADIGHFEWEVALADTLMEHVSRGDIIDELRGLPVRDYRILDLYYTHELTDQQVASFLGMPPAAVKVQRYRILARIRRGLRMTPSRLD